MRALLSPVYFHGCLIFPVGGLQGGKGSTRSRWGSKEAYQNPTFLPLSLEMVW